MGRTKEGIDKYTIIVEAINAPCSLIDITNGQNINSVHKSIVFE